MTNSLIDSRLRKVLKKTAAPQTGWLDVFPAVIGTASGTVQTGVDGIIYVRNILNGQILSVYNFTVPNTAGLQVEVGRKVETPGLWQVKGVREAYARPAGGSVGSASHTHENLFISPNRYLRFLTLPIEGGGFTVQIYGDVFRNSSGIVTSIANQQLDLSSYVPSSGAKWVVIQADSTGAISVNEGDAVESKELLTLLYIPDPVDDYVESCAVRLYDGQVQLYRDPSSINDFVDLRGLRTWGISLSLDDLLDVSVSVANDGDVLTYDAFYDLWLPVAPTGGGAVDSVNGQTGTVVIDYDSVSSNDGDTDVTGAELEELTDGSTTNLHSHAGSGGGDPYVCQGRLTLETGVPVSTSDQSAKTTLYFTPFKGNQIGLYDGSSAWDILTFSELSLSLSGFTADKNYDIWVYNNSGSAALDSTVWTDDTNRATALTKQDGVYVKTGATTRRYIGTIRINSSGGQCEDTITQRFVWNYYNRVIRELSKEDTTTHTYSSSTWRAWNNDTSQYVEYVIGVYEEVPLISQLLSVKSTSGGAGGRINAYFTSHSSGTNVTSILGTGNTNSERVQGGNVAFMDAVVGAGYYWVGCIESASGSVTTFYQYKMMVTLIG